MIFTEWLQPTPSSEFFSPVIPHDKISNDLNSHRKLGCGKNTIYADPKVNINPKELGRFCRPRLKCIEQILARIGSEAARVCTRFSCRPEQNGYSRNHFLWQDRYLKDVGNSRIGAQSTERVHFFTHNGLPSLLGWDTSGSTQYLISSS